MFGTNIGEYVHIGFIFLPVHITFDWVTTLLLWKTCILWLCVIWIRMYRHHFDTPHF